MTIKAQPWLPADMVPPPALSVLFDEVVVAWSTRWFAGDAMRFAPLRHEGRTDLSWRGLDVGLMLGTASDTALQIGARMLGVSAEDRAVPDRLLLEEVAENSLVDLRARLSGIVEAGAAADWRPATRGTGWCAAIGVPAMRLAVALANPLFALLVARVLPTPPAIRLGSGGAALAAAQVLVSAAVGRAELTVADLRALEIGDVVVLDRPLADPVPIALDGHALARGTARVVANEPPFLEVVHPVIPT